MNNRYKISIFDREFVAENMMGPNSLMIVEELTKDLNLKKGMRVLDLGSGTGLTSIFLAKEFDVEVYSVDLWTNPTENYERFKKMNVENKVIPLCFNAKTMPFANEYFDAIISVDSYHYFGNDDNYFGDYIAPILKNNGQIAIAFPSIRQDFEFKNIPIEMKPFWSEQDFNTWRSTNWWNNIFKRHLSNYELKEMNCYNDAWTDWLSLDNEYAIPDREMFKIDNGKYMNIISITGNVNK